MKHLILFLSAFMAVATIFGQSNKAKSILDKLSEKTQSYSTIQTEFVFTHRNIQENIEEAMQGNIILKGNKYVLKLDPVVITSNAKQIWNYNKESQEVTINDFDNDEESMLNPSKMFTMYQKGFKYKFIQERFENGRALYIIDLYPQKVEETEYSRIQLHIDKDKMQIYKINYIGKDENRFIIELKTFKTNDEIAESTFTLSKKNYPEGTEFTDMTE